MPKPDDKQDPAPQEKPPIGGFESGERNRRKAEKKVTEPLAPEAQGGAGAGRKWPGDS